MASKMYGEGDVTKFYDTPTISSKKPMAPSTDWSTKTQWDPMNQWSYKSALQPTAGEANWKRLADATISNGEYGDYKGYDGSGQYKGNEGSGVYQDGMLFEERLANLAPELSTLAETAYQGHKINEQNRIIQNAKLNSLRAPVTSVAAASDMSPEVLAARQNDIARIRGQYQGADPTMRLISNQMAQQQRDTARGQLNAQRSQHLDQELHRVQQENARNQAASVDTANKNALRAQQLYDNKLAARVAHSERERELFTKGFGTIMDKLEDRLEGQRTAEAMDLDREMAATNYEAQALGQQIKANPLNYKLKMDLAKKQQHLTNLMRRPTPRYRHFEF